MTTNEAPQQGVAPMSDYGLAELNYLVSQAEQQGLINLEFDMRKERIDPYRIDITKPFKEVEPLIAIDGSSICSPGNISAVVGEAKSKKTFLTTAIVASAMSYRLNGAPHFNNVSRAMGLIVLWLDTEQGQGHIRKVVTRINEMTGIKHVGESEDVRLNVYALRELDPKQRRAVLYDALYTIRPELVVIDGIADLLYDSNDLRESEALVGELMAISTNYNCHILCVLHTNPGSDKARGHLGSALQRKCETVIYVHKDNDMSIVEPQFCRNEPFERFAFRINDDGIPELCDLPTDTNSDSEVVSILRSYYGGSVERTVLTNKLCEQLNINTRAAIMRISRAIRKGLVVERDKRISTPDFCIL